MTRVKQQSHSKLKNSNRLLTKKRSQRPKQKSPRRVRTKKNRTKNKKRGGEYVEKKCHSFEDCVNNEDNKTTTCRKTSTEVNTFSCQRKPFFNFSPQNVVERYFEYGNSNDGNVYALIKKQQNPKKYHIFKKIETDKYEQITDPSSIIGLPEEWKTFETNTNNYTVSFKREGSDITETIMWNVDGTGKVYWKYSKKD